MNLLPYQFNSPELRRKMGDFGPNMTGLDDQAPPAVLIVIGGINTHARARSRT